MIEAILTGEITLTNTFWVILAIYYSVINLVAFGSMYLDKRKAKKGQWRTPEKTLHFMSLLGGFVGSYFGMQTFRHKTQHKIFYVVNALALVLHAALWIFIIF